MPELPLSTSVLKKRILLPEKPSSLILEGHYVRLEPLTIQRANTVATYTFRCSSN